MRILRLELERYGHFTGKTLEFRPDANLHVIYGPNEAGKTSSLSAIADLLFGFGARTNYNFIHANNTLSLGATITAKDGRKLSFKRRKGASRTILDSHGGVLSDDVLTPFLGMIDRSIFSNAWGLSKESLRAGAEEMLKSGGEAGSSLFAAASGLKGLIEIQRRLETEALNIFAPTKAQHRTFYQARDRFEAAAKQIRALELATRDLRERRGIIENLKVELANIRERRAEDIKRREFLVRQREIGPILQLIAADEDLLRAWEHLPVIDANCVQLLRRALNASEVAQAELDRLRNEETAAKVTFETFVVDGSLLALGPAIQLLVTDSGNYAAEKTQLPRVQSEADAFELKLKELAIALGLSEDADLAPARPDQMLVLRLKEQIVSGKAVAASLATNNASIRKEKDNLEVLKKRQAGSISAGDPKPFREKLTRLLPTLGQLKEIERLERSTAKESAHIREKAAQLSPPVIDLDALAQASLPIKEVIDEYAQVADSLDAERTSLQGQLREVDRILPTLQSRVDELADGHTATSPERIASARSDRDNRWLPLRSVLLQEKVTLPIANTVTQVLGFEECSGIADRLADDAVQNADRLASHAAALKSLNDETLKQSNLSQRLTEKEREIASHERKWQELWQSYGLSPATPVRMLGWLQQVHDLIERRLKHREEAQRLAQLQDAVTAIRPSLIQLGESLGICEAANLPVNLLFTAVDSELEQRAEAWRKSSDLVTRLAAGEERIEALELEREDLLTVEHEWTAAWSEVLSLMRLPHETTIDGAAAALDIWSQVPSLLNQHADRLRRVQGMNRDMTAFQERTSALLLQLQEPDLGIGADAAIKMVSDRLKKAQQVETKADVALAHAKELESKVIEAEGKVSNAVKALEALCTKLPSSDSRVQQISALEEREAVLERLRGRRQTLLPLSRGQSESELRQALESFDETAGVAETEELKIKETQHNQQENETFASLRRAEDELAQLEAGVGAEVALQFRKNAEAQLIDSTREWSMKRLAQILLSHAIEQHRCQQEQPLLRRASQLFSLLTSQSFSGVDQEFDDNDNIQLVGRRDAEHAVSVPAMSEGTRDQLYFALRLAFLEEYAQKAEPMPFIGDDLLTSFDDERTLRGLTALSATGMRIQPILFTHHMRVVELAQAELGDKVDVINLN
jgi:uncharacterized protein YhaN